MLWQHNSRIQSLNLLPRTPPQPLFIFHRLSGAISSKRGPTEDSKTERHKATCRPRSLLSQHWIGIRHQEVAVRLPFVEESAPWLSVSSILLGIEACRGLAAVRGGMSALEGAA